MSLSTQDITRQWASLPASQIAVGVNEALHTNSSLVVTAPPGAGKSTLLPLTILSSLGEGEKILMLEPRRLAARQIAERMAQMLGEQVGETVGYRVRFESRVSKRTRIEVLTEGILTRMIVDDATLDGVSVVIFDEFHERSINSDLALALTRQAQQIIRPDLKVVIMSATIDTSNICAALQAPLIESEGRMFPVELHYADEDTDPRYIAAAAASTTIEAYKKYEGDILVFLPGQAEIEQCYELLSKSQHFTASPSQPINTSTHQHLTTSTSQPTTTTPHHLTIHPLYGNLSPEDQRRAIAPSAPGERKIVIATPIAETSITIEGVRVVIDAGLCRQVVFDARTGLSHLETVRISMDMATQRMGRAGRVAEGVCYRLWTKASEHLMAEQRKPEIEEADLAPMLLDTAAFGESDAEALPWLTMPPRAGVFKAKELLTALGAIDENGNITSIGKRMATLPCHPRIARMILATTNLTTSTPQEVHLSPLGFCRLPEQEHLNILFAGRLEPQKGVVVLCKVLKMLAGDARFFFTIAGDGSQRTLVEQTLAEIAAEGKSVNAELVPPIFGLAGYMQSFDYLFMPSEFEGLSMLSMEASLNRLPVIANACPGLADTLPTDWSLFAHGNNIDDYRRIFNLLPTADRDALTQQAYAFAKERFSVRTMQERYEAWYKAKRSIC